MKDFNLQEWLMENQPSEDTLHQPKAFPTPIPDLIDRHVRATLPETADRDDQQPDPDLYHCRLEVTSDSYFSISAI